MSALRRFPPCIALTASLWVSGVHAGSGTLLGDWLEPSGAVIRVAPCELGVCMQIVALPRRRHPDTDLRNPNPKLRDRPLCGLRVGEDFVERDPQHADGGHVYDPRNGRTYRSVMRADGDLLELRGYVGLKLFGRSETWVRVERTFIPCRKK